MPALVEKEQDGRRFRPGLAATLFTVAAVAIMLGLGTWQVERLAWKNALIERIESGLRAAPVPLPSAIENPADWDFRRVSVTGRFLHDHELDLAARSMNGRIGYQIVTPLKRDDGSLVLVNRGWVPLDKRAPESRPEGLPNGTVTVEGVARVPAPQGWMQPDNDPIANMWFWYDVPRMAAQVGPAGADPGAGAGEPLPVIVEAGDAPNPGGFPIGGRTNVNIANNHLQYAFTWYSLAVTLIVIYFVFHWRRGSRDGEP
jgi:surfeit locus 1 family protein